MSFINGLKNIFKKPIFAIIVVIFIIEWILILLAATFIPYTNFIDFLIVCVGYLGGFTLILLIFSFFLTSGKDEQVCNTNCANHYYPFFTDIYWIRIDFLRDFINI